MPGATPDFASNVTDLHPDYLSAAAAKLLQESKATAFQRLVITGPTPPATRQAMGNLKPSDLLSADIVNADDAQAVLAGLWLWLDGLHEAHQIVQDLIGPTGAFWHAIMHRMEGDFSNAKYWYDRCSTHRTMKLLGAVSSDAVGPEAAKDPMVLHVVAGDWNPGALVDLVAAVHNKPTDPRYTAAVRLQQIEWQALFHHCVLEAVGVASE